MISSKVLESADKIFDVLSDGRELPEMFIKLVLPSTLDTFDAAVDYLLEVGLIKASNMCGTNAATLQVA